MLLDAQQNRSVIVNSGVLRWSAMRNVSASRISTIFAGGKYIDIRVSRACAGNGSNRTDPWSSRSSQPSVYALFRQLATR